MALAILDLLDYDEASFQFQIDTGTNPYYQIRAGTGVRRDLGIDLLDQVYYTTPLAQNPQGDLFESSREIAVPAKYFDQPNTYAQLFSFKTPDRKSPAFSRAIRIPVGYKLPQRGPSDYAASFSRTTTMTNGSSYRKPRRIPCRSAALARQASFDDILGAVLKIAAPIVTDLLKGAAPGGGTAPTGGAGAPADIIAQLLKSVLGAIPWLAAPPVSTTKSRRVSKVNDNRFARQFIFGIDDALIGAAIGQVVQILPQLANAANQKRIELHKADTTLTAGILADINKRLMMDKLAELQKQPAGGASTVTPEQIQQLLALLQQAPATPAPAPAQQQSLPSFRRRSYAFSNRATLSFDLGEAVPWNGSPKNLFTRSRNVVLMVRLNVGDPVPKAPLPKALLKIVFKDSADPAVQFEKTFKRKDVFAGAVMDCSFEPGELAHLPIGKSIAVVAELRWISAKSGKEVRALGSTDIVFVNQFFLKDQGTETGPDIELRDMKLYRAFWNKVWEAPVLDSANGGGRKKYMWELDANLRYSVLLSASHESNGMMEPKLLAGKTDRESLSKKTEGRMKAGIELAVAELNKLQPLWNAQPLDAAHLQAFAAADFLNRNAVELVHRLRLKGKVGQRGMVWVIPVFKMFGFKLVTASKIADSGQVLAVSEEDTHLPLPVAARLIGLTATSY